MPTPPANVRITKVIRIASGSMFEMAAEAAGDAGDQAVGRASASGAAAAARAGLLVGGLGVGHGGQCRAAPAPPPLGITPSGPYEGSTGATPAAHPCAYNVSRASPATRRIVAARLPCPARRQTGLRPRRAHARGRSARTEARTSRERDRTAEAADTLVLRPATRRRRPARRSPRSSGAAASTSSRSAAGAPSAPAELRRRTCSPRPVHAACGQGVSASSSARPPRAPAAPPCACSSASNSCSASSRRSAAWTSRLTASGSSPRERVLHEPRAEPSARRIRPPANASDARDGATTPRDLVRRERPELQHGAAVGGRVARHHRQHVGPALEPVQPRRVAVDRDAERVGDSGAPRRRARCVSPAGWRRGAARSSGAAASGTIGSIGEPDPASTNARGAARAAVFGCTNGRDRDAGEDLLHPAARTASCPAGARRCRRGASSCWAPAT